MKILLDHGTPRPLRRELLGHSVDTAADKGWDRLANGDLIDSAEQDGYEILITTDRNMKHQQNLVGRRLAIIVLLSGLGLTLSRGSKTFEPLSLRRSLGS